MIGQLIKLFSNSIFVVTILLCSTMCFAERGFYLGGTVGHTRQHFEPENADDDIDKDIVGTVRAGYDVNDYVGIETSYSILSNFDIDVAQDLDAEQLDLTLVFKLPVSRVVSFYAQGGSASWRTELREGSDTDKDQVSGSSYGFGIRIQPIRHLMITAALNYSKLDTLWFATHYDVSVRTLNAGLYYHF